VGLEFYRNDNNFFYPRHSSIGGGVEVPRKRWPDEILPYFEQTDVFVSPLLDDVALKTSMRPWSHTVDQETGANLPDTEWFGGYGYNYHYLGNSRKPGGILPFYAGTKDIKDPVNTLVLADTKGTPAGNVDGDGNPLFDYKEGPYVVDPPLQSRDYGSRGSRRTSADPDDAGNYGYKGGDGSAGTVVPEHRSTPDARNSGDRVAILFADGHGEQMPLRELDDFDGDDQPDNGYWNGRGDPTVR